MLSNVIITAEAVCVNWMAV